jgi:chaperonin GroES
MNIKPLGDHVVVKLMEEEKVTASGIVLPDTIDKDKKEEGVVVAVGPGKMLDSGKRADMEVSVGQKVLFKKWGGDEVKVAGEEYKIIRMDDILAVLQ